MEASSQGLSAEAPKPVKLLDQLRTAIRVRHYAIRTEQAYVDWARRYILFHRKRRPADMEAEGLGHPRKRTLRRFLEGLGAGHACSGHSRCP